MTIKLSNADLELFKDELANIWVTPITSNTQENYRTGSRHVFCGEPSNKLGGIYFIARYVEAQENQLAGAILLKALVIIGCQPTSLHTCNANYGLTNKADRGDSGLFTL
ncbi:MAG: hypothetical protein PV340_05230 [Wolbachia sp.]|nr:hypothetical protein [Wolbachia sp.]MDD9336076.1 hypothetical protein [Wolbachia sp.]